MEDQLNLRVNDDNKVVVVETVEQETPISSAELQRQIDEHETIISNLKSKLSMVEQFEEDNSEALAPDVEPEPEVEVEEEPINEGVEDNE